ncbi:SP_1767 family glycosyltransferase [Lactobacillus selangorensis]|nr:SP_1767 family glycosyltransferase [Lactobacillus selangorensis]
MASCVVVQTEQMAQQMRTDGVTAPLVLQNGWDFLTTKPFSKEQLQKKIHPASQADSSCAVWKTKNATSDFGVAQPADSYSRYSLAPEVFMYLAMGMPGIAWQNSAVAKLISHNHLGYVIQSLNESEALFSSLNEQTLKELQQRVQGFGRLLRNGFFTRLLLAAVEKSVFKDTWHFEQKLTEQPVGNIHVLSIPETLTYIKEHHASVARFGDGEFEIMKGNDIALQRDNPVLAEKLKEVVSYQSDEKLLICLPDVFADLSKYKDSTQYFWQRRRRNTAELFKGIDTSGVYGSAFISRPYLDLKDHYPSQSYFEQLKDLWYQRDILIVEGKNTRSGEGNDLFADARSIERILCPSTNAFSKLAAIETAIKKFGQHRLVLVMLGPTAKIIVYDLLATNDWLIDIGHIDSEYEWFKLGVSERVKIPHKHTAEIDLDSEELMDNPDFNKQVVLDLSSK